MPFLNSVRGTFGTQAQDIVEVFGEEPYYGIQPIATAYAHEPVSNLVITDIPQTFDHLYIIVKVLTSSQNYGGLIFNGDTGNNYYASRFMGYDSTVDTASSQQANTNAMYLAPGSTYYPGIGKYIIPDYTSTKLKSGVITGGWAGSSANRNFVSSFLWNSTAAITRVQLNSDTYSRHTSISVYGIGGTEE